MSSFTLRAYVVAATAGWGIFALTCLGSAQELLISSPTLPSIATSSAVLISSPSMLTDFSTRPIAIASFRQTQFTLSMPILYPFERLLREKATECTLLHVDNVTSHFNGDTYMYRLPAWLKSAGPEGASSHPSTSTVQVLGTWGGFFALIPPDPSLMERFYALIADPNSYSAPRQPQVRRYEAQWTSAFLEDGARIHTLRLKDLEAKSYPQWRNTLAIVYKIRFSGRDLEAVFLYKTLGGDGRVASALQSLRGQYAENLLALNRGDIFSVGPAASTGPVAARHMGRLGIRASVVGLGELSRLQDMLDYRNSDPQGLRFISANLVYSTAPQQSLLEPFAIFEVGGKRVAVIGLTRPDWQGVLPAQHAKTLILADPVATAQRWMRALRARADIVVALSNLSASDNARLKDSVVGLDFILGDDLPINPDNAPEAIDVRDPERSPYDPALLISSDGQSVLTYLEISHDSFQRGYYALTARQRHILLDESLPDQEGYPDFDPEVYGVSLDTHPPLLPSARRLYADQRSLAFPRLESRHFWSLAASLAADRTRSEIAFLPMFSITLRTMGDFREPLVREWFPWEDSLVVFELPGAALQSLLREAREQAAKERAGTPFPAGELRLTFGGIGEGDKIHGVAIQPNAVYKVAGTQRLLAHSSQFPALKQAKNIRIREELREIVISELRKAAQRGWSVDRYRPLLEGRPLTERGLWQIHFRDISVNVSNTKVVRDNAFARVPNSRIQGFDQLIVGGTSKVDADYYRGPYKWANALEVEYSRSRLRPPGQAAVINTPNNRVSLLTVGTMRVGSFPWTQVARSFGPSLGFQYEGQVEKNLGLRRKHIYSLYPGIEFFGGSFFQSIVFSANLKRDASRDVTNNQYGLRERMLFSAALGQGKLQGEFWVNYFVRTPQDSQQDLLWEGDFNLKLQIPIFRHFTIGPFLDFYFFALKVRPLSGYSAITGLSLGFSRLWKPQYELF